MKHNRKDFNNIQKKRIKKKFNKLKQIKNQI